MPYQYVWARVRAWVRGPWDPPGPPPVDPGYGVEAPVYPDQGLPGSPDYPSQGLPGSPDYPSQGLPPSWTGRPSHPIVKPPLKPPGIPVLPIDPGWSVPVGPPSFPGDWHPVDPGYGLPPVWGFLPVDPGFGVPAGGTPTQPIAPGHWLPIDPGYGVRPCPPWCQGGEVAQPKWVWIPEVDANFGKRPKKPK